MPEFQNIQIGISLAMFEKFQIFGNFQSIPIYFIIFRFQNFGLELHLDQKKSENFHFEIGLNRNFQSKLQP